MLAALQPGGAYFFRALSDAVEGPDDADLVAALWDLTWSGYLTNDTLTPLRARLSGGRTAHKQRRSAPRSRYGGGRYGALRAARATTGRPAMPTRQGPPAAAGRWSLLPDREADPTVRAHAAAEILLERHGVVTRGAVAAERVPGGFAAVYRVLAAFEDAGRVRRGYFVTGLGAAQFGTTGAIDRLRAGVRPLGADADEDRAGGPPDGPGGWHGGDGTAPDLDWAGGTAGRPGGPGGGGRGPSRPGGPWNLRGRAPGPTAASRTVVLAAADPANPYGAALAWPERATEPGAVGAGHRPGRKAGALVVLVDGDARPLRRARRPVTAVLAGRRDEPAGGGGRAGPGGPGGRARAPDGGAGRRGRGARRRPSPGLGPGLGRVPCHPEGSADPGLRHRRARPGPGHPGGLRGPARGPVDNAAPWTTRPGGQRGPAQPGGDRGPAVGGQGSEVVRVKLPEPSLETTLQ